MPNRWAISSGNWSNTAIWNNGGVLGLPTASDNVFASGSIITMDQNISVNSLSVAGLTGTASAGGTFITSGSRTVETFASGTYGGFLTSVLAGAGGSPALIITGSDTVNIKARQITGAPNAAGVAISGSIWIKSSGITNISSSISIRGALYSALNITTVSGGTVNIESPQIFGDTLGGGGAPRQAIVISIGCTVNITGSIFGGTNSNSFGIQSSATGLILNVLGSVYTNTAYNGIVVSAGTGTINVTGSIYTTNAATATAISIGGTSINMNASASITAGGTSAIAHSTLGTSNLQGPISASATVPGIQFSNTSHNLNATGPFHNVNNRNAVFAQNLQLISGSTPTWTFDTETTQEQRTLYTQNYPGNFPSTSNVRQGTVFGDTAQFTGVVAIPPTGSVLKGVPVDNTTGSTSFTTQNVWSLDVNNLTITGSLGARLRNVATVATDGAAIASKGKL
jgi:hypothetical protein